MKFIHFASGVFRGLGRSVTEDTNVFLLAASAALGGRRGISRALLVYVLLRRADDYFGRMDQWVETALSGPVMNTNEQHPN